MNLIVETDLGHDPDDFFTICYLIAAGVDIRAIVVTPGDPDQLAVARTLSEELGLNIPIGYHKVSEKLSSGSIHKKIVCDHFGRKFSDKGDGFGKDIIKQTMKKYPDCEWFIIGPPSNIGRYLESRGEVPTRCTMQGGFLGYDLHSYANYRLPQFEGKTWMPTFNMNGDRKGTVALIDSGIPDLRFCGKNVCHSVVLDQSIVDTLPTIYKNKAAELFCLAAKLLMEKKDGKKFHDPVAAVCHLHPEVGCWVLGKVQKIESGWGTVVEKNPSDLQHVIEGSLVLAELDRPKFWEYIRNFV